MFARSRFASNSWNSSGGDKAVFQGVGVALGLIAIGILFSGKITAFFDLPSFAIVVGGTFGATLANYSISDLRHAWSTMQSVLKSPDFRPFERIQYMVQLSQMVKRGGVLVLEEQSRSSSDPFLRLALEMTADGHSAPEIKRILETEMRVSNDRALRAVQVFETAGCFAPALGLIGTLIGLIQMLGSLNNPAAVGPGMALALVTTLYGAIFANVILLPMAGKLRIRSEEA
ncbi:MAG: MotA/TolQ/ExbB proton channel family protein, partial [Oligoflexia bacterium]|nr:MotA/TolQ/ExbB proton channel family protein [Oligoflexia bacterium]